jgi:hypothetical protein
MSDEETPIKHWQKPPHELVEWVPEDGYDDEDAEEN